VQHEVGRGEDLFIDGNKITVKEDDPPDLIFRLSGQPGNISTALCDAAEKSTGKRIVFMTRRFKWLLVHFP
jgi:hypothetical protein